MGAATGVRSTEAGKRDFHKGRCDVESLGDKLYGDDLVRSSSRVSSFAGLCETALSIFS